MTDRKRVSILMGGGSAEREISLITGCAVASGINADLYDARTVELGPLGCFGRNPSTVKHFDEARRVEEEARRSGEMPWAEQIGNVLMRTAQPPDIVFIALHGRYGEDGGVQGLLELLGIPYTGCGVLSSALCFDKAATKQMLRGVDIRTPDWMTLREIDVTDEVPAQVADTVGFPCIIKPNREGSTIGATVVREVDQVAPAICEALKHDDIALVEKYIQGTELTVSVLGNRFARPLPVIEIRPKSGFYDYESKYTKGKTDFTCPAQLPKEVTEQLQDIALKTHQVLQCSGMSRVDFMLDEDGPAVLEVNTIPGMTPTSLMPRAASVAGLSFTDLITEIIEFGLAEGVR